MARGGYRPGAGRPKGARSVKESAPGPLPADIKTAARKSKLSPLDYMLAVMNDDEAEAARRDRMAIAAAPCVPARPGDRPQGKKEAAQEAAQTAGAGTEWGDDLAGPALN